MVELPTQATALAAELQSRLRQQAVVVQLGKRALANLDLQTLADDAVRMVAETLDVELCKVLELEPGGESFLLRAGVGWKEGLVGRARVGAGKDSQAGYTLVSLHPIIVEDMRTETRFDGPPLLHEHGVISGLSVAISGNERPYGVFGAHTTNRREFTPDDLNFIHSIANVLAAAIERGKIVQQLKDLNLDLERQVAERTRLIRLIQETTVAANEAQTVSEALEAVLAQIAAFTGWPVGHVFVPDEAGLAPGGCWYAADPKAYAPFQRRTERSHYLAGEGLPGRVLVSGLPEWGLDLEQDLPGRLDSAREAGLLSGIALPVRAGDNILAVMEFYSGEVLQPEPALEEALGNIGRQVGRVIAHHHVEEDLKESQQQLTEAQDIARLGSWAWDIPSNRVTWSDTLYDIYGVQPESFDASYEAFLARVHVDDRERVAGIIEGAYRDLGSFQFVHRIVRPDGEVRFLQARGKVLADSAGQAVQMVGTGQDITERKAMEDRLHAREVLLRSAVTGAPIILWAIDKQGQITLVEGKGLTALDQNPASYVGTSIYDQIQENPEVEAYIRRAMAGEEVISEVQSNELFFETRYAPMQAEDGEIVGVTGVSIDITERRLAEAARHESEARFRSIFESGPMGIALLNLEGRFVLANPAFTGLLALSPTRLAELSVWDFSAPDDRDRVQALVQALLDEDRETVQSEETWVREDGQVIWVNMFLALVRETGGAPQYITAMVKDITARKKIAAELEEIQRQLIASREKERLHLAQEIHDEPLQGLYGLLYQLDILQMGIIDEDGKAELKTMEADLRRVIHTLRAICGELRPPTLAPFGLEVALREHAEGFQESTPEIQVDLDLMYDGQSLPEHHRLTLFRVYQQALGNIIRHAEAKNVTIRFQFDQGNATLEVEDDGKGFLVPDRWVEFVRKDHYGLAGAAERVEMLGGDFKVRSAPGQGVLVQATIPRSLEA